jgi:hypothetical protein
MGVGHGIEHVEKQAHALAHRQCTRITPDVDGFAVHVLENEIGLAVLHASVEQTGDERVRQASEQRAFARETHAADASQPLHLWQLDCDVAFESPIVTATEPDAAHAARSELALEHVRSETATGQRWQRIQKSAEAGSSLPASSSRSPAATSGRSRSSSAIQASRSLGARSIA